ncbi:Udp-glycosyltransferase 83a1-like [Thalictrum thalictroides]|uniref:Udp-glycosyltransferase 83a1-like n=1 Tax=Thalictrum thalictroides TaxID=46969 RepID=A0A7J6WI86_THATH|nr:Udp-glycosyltransferase 83a1-like [Thalictrum thalictroides]
MGKLPHVLVVPLPAQGHVMPLMKFSYQLVDHGVKVTFINTESVHKKVVSTLLDVEVVKPDNKIRLVAIPDEPIIVKGEEKSIEFISETMAAHLENVINKINASDNEKIDCVVADACLGGILEVAERFGINGAAFWPASLGFLACMLHFPKLVEAGEVDDNGTYTN